MDTDPFLPFLSKHDPGQLYAVKLLTGGVVNFTARASRDIIKSNNLSAKYPTHPSLVLKHAPPYVAQVGESAPFSQRRQLIEARALELVALLLPPLTHQIVVPTLLHADSEAHILVISDLGNLPNLSDIFSNLGGWTSSTPSPSLREMPTTIPPACSLYFNRLGQKLGDFFAKLHSPRTLNNVPLDPFNRPSYLYNAALQSSVRQFSILPIRKNLALFPAEFSHESEAEQLFKCIDLNFMREPFTRTTKPILSEHSLVLGDCWPGAVLVSPPPLPSFNSSSPAIFDPSENPDPKVCVIDWEFASTTGRGVHGDMAQLLAHLEVFRIVAKHNMDTFHQNALDTMVAALVRAYVTSSRREKAAWVSDGKNSDRSDDDIKFFFRTTIMRSLVVSFAAEMINCAFWKVWRCNDERCMVEEEHTGEDGVKSIKQVHTKVTQDCYVINDIIHAAVQWLRLAAGPFERNHWGYSDKSNVEFWKRVKERANKGDDAVEGILGLFELDDNSAKSSEKVLTPNMKFQLSNGENSGEEA